MAAENLLRDSWVDLDQADLRLVLQQRIIGGQGQYDGGDDVLYLPLARKHCRVALRFRGTRIVAIEPGAAFDRAQWDAICTEIETSVLKGQRKVGRDLSFSTHLVKGGWIGARSGVQILPPPDNAPLAGEGGDNPFILEFPFQDTSLWAVANYRRIREHRRLTLVLNLLLIGTTTFLPDRRRHFWTNVGGDAGPEIRWVNEQYFANIGEAVVNELSSPPTQKLTELASDEYYGTGIGLDGQGLRVPDDLDDSLW